LKDNPEQESLARYERISSRKERARKKLKRNNCGNIKEFGDFSLIDHTKWKK
jgi:hypothetical protein